MRSPSSHAAWRIFAVACIFGLLAGCAVNDAPDDDLSAIHAPEVARIVPASEALAGAYVPTLDPAPLTDSEIEKALGTRSYCEFRYTSAGRPVLAWQVISGKGVVKLNGHLVLLEPASTGDRLTLTAGPIRVTAVPDRGGTWSVNERQEEASAVFEVGTRLRAGYQGYYKCSE